MSLGLIAAASWLLVGSPPQVRREIRRWVGKEDPSGSAKRSLRGGEATQVFSRLSRYFEENRGQAPSRFRYVSHGRSHTMFLAPAEVLVRFEAGIGRRARSREQDRGQRIGGMSLRFVGANSKARAEAASTLPGRTNYFMGNEPSQWRLGVPNHSRIVFSGVYPGIDAVYYGRGDLVEYDLVVSPGADPARIHVHVEGAESVRLDEGGDLIMTSSAGKMRQRRPKILQAGDGGAWNPIAGGFVLNPGGCVRFEVGEHDATAPLIIDPILDFSTYLGGNDGEVGYGITVDAAGNVYVTGLVQSLDFPIQNALQGGHAGGGGLNRSDAFVTKFDASGNSMLYSTYLGGRGDDVAYAIEVDGSGNAYVTGSTESEDFPTRNPLQSRLGDRHGDAFVAKISASGSELSFSTYLGGMDPDVGLGIVTDDQGHAYVAGWTQSLDFPVHKALQPNFPGFRDGFIAKLHPSGSSLVYSTFFGGSGDDTINSVAADPTGNVHVAGSTLSPDFPTFNALPALRGGSTDAFVAKIDASGTALHYSMLAGGSASDRASGVGLDGAGNVYVGGQTFSRDFPVANALQPSSGGDEDAFVFKLNSTGSSLIYSTYLGGNALEWLNAAAVDASGQVYLTGVTRSSDFPTLGSVQPAYGGGFFGDAFLTKINAAGTGLIYSCFIGGNDLDYGYGVSADASGNAYVVGETFSTNFPTARALQPSFQGIADAFVLKIEDRPAQLFDIEMSRSSYVDGESVTMTDFRFRNLSGFPVMVGVQIQFFIPGAAPITLVDIGADGSFSLPAAFDQNFGPLTLFPVDSSKPKGRYEIVSRLSSPGAKRLLYEDRNPFDIR